MHAPSTRPSSRGSQRLGVPPPKKTLSIRAPLEDAALRLELAEDRVGVAAWSMAARSCT